jgi:hypothetical protein
MFKRLLRQISAIQRDEAVEDIPISLRKHQYNNVDSDILSVILSFIDVETKRHRLVVDQKQTYMLVCLLPVKHGTCSVGFQPHHIVFP